MASAPAPASLVKGKGLLKMESSDGEEWGREHEEGEEEDREREGAPKGGADGGAAQATPGWSCTQCESRYTDKENYITHMADLHGKVSPPFLHHYSLVGHSTSNQQMPSAQPL